MKIDEIKAPDGRTWPLFWARWIWTDHGFRGVDLSNSILADIRMLLLGILLVLMWK